MAYRVFGHVRVTAALAAVAAAAIIVPSVASASPTDPSNDTAASARADAADTAGRISSVQKRLAKLSEQSDQLVEKYNQANIRLHDTRVAAAKATKAYHLAEHKLTVARDQFSASAAAQYEGGTFSATGALLSSDSGSSYLDQLDTLSMLSNHNAQTMNTFAVTQKQAAAAKKTADALLAQARANQREVAAQKKQTGAQITKFQDLLDSLNAQQKAIWERQQLLAHQQAAIDTQAKLKQFTPVIKSIKLPKTNGVPSASIGKVIAFAEAQIGKPYVWGSAGPGSYDCSGLTMMAYQQAGISLPHSAAGQFGYGHHVSASDLQPGDLLFYYQPIGHVAIYVGDGMMVSAPQTGENVKLIPADTTNSFTGATRLIG